MKTPSRRNIPVLAALLLLLVVSATCVMPDMFTKPQDRGGVYLLLAIDADADNLEQSAGVIASIIQMRCDYLGIYCKVERQSGAGSSRLMVRVSGAKDMERVKVILLAEGMELRAVVSTLNPAPLQIYPTRDAALAATSAESDVRPYKEADNLRPGTEKFAGDRFLVVERKIIITGQDVRDARAMHDSSGGENYSVAFSLRPEASSRFAQWTSMNIGRYIAIILNGEVRSAPFIRSQIFDNGQITGKFSKEQAEDVALILRSGNLPAPVELIEEGAYKP